MSSNRPAPVTIPLSFADVVAVTQSLFGESLHICGSDTEPLYEPAHLSRYQRPTLHVMRDSLPSLLHELSHWCIAGKERRQLVDFGYWYKPDGRNITEQNEFQSFESKPQAIEWILSVAVGRTFVVSLDNLSAGTAPKVCSTSFIDAIVVRAMHYLQSGLPPRAQQLLQALMQRASSQHAVDELRFQLMQGIARPKV